MNEHDSRGDVVLFRRKGCRERAEDGDVVDARPAIPESRLGSNVKDPEVWMHRLPNKQDEPNDDVIDRGPPDDGGSCGKPQGRPRRMRHRTIHKPKATSV